MLFVNGRAVKLLGSCNSLLWGVVFDESISTYVSMQASVWTLLIVPFSLALVIHRHEETILLDFPHLVELLYQEFDKLWFALLWNYRQPICDYKCV